MVAIDDDNNGDDPISISDGGSAVQLPDAVTYELSGADAGYFDIVPATGQILTVKKLDYEDKNVFNVTVKAEDVAGLSDTIDMTINVLDVDEVPVPDVLRITGKSSHTYEENDMEPVGEYKVAAGGDATPGAWTLEGADASSFTLTGSGTTRMLEFRSSPDYDANSDNMYEVTLKVTDSINSETYDTFAVTVTVTNVDELGVLSGPASASVNEGDTDLGTYELTAIEDGPAVTWSLDGTDMSDFELSGTGLSRMLMFTSAPDYESPMGGAADDSNTYMVTVMAEAGGEMEMVAVTITVDNAEEAGAVTLNPTRPSVGTAITATLADADIVETVSWQWASADAMDGTFTNITGATMETYTPVEADGGKYLRATATYDDGFDAGNYAMAVSASAVTQLAVNGPDAVDHPENTTSVNATYTASGASGTVAWTVSGDDAGAFSISGGMLTFNTAPNFEAAADANTDNMYNVTVVATADGNMDTHDLTVTVSNVNEAGTVTLSTMSPAVGNEVTASLTDPDSGVTGTTWQWVSADAMDGNFTNIDGADSASYTPVEDDAGMYLQATASYTDGHGTGKMASSGPVMVNADTADIVAGYDTNNTPGIQISELFNAIDDYFAGEISISQLFEVIDAYFG